MMSPEYKTKIQNRFEGQEKCVLVDNAFFFYQSKLAAVVVVKKVVVTSKRYCNSSCSSCKKMGLIQ